MLTSNVFPQLVSISAISCIEFYSISTNSANTIFNVYWVIYVCVQTEVFYLSLVCPSDKVYTASVGGQSK